MKPYILVTALALTFIAPTTLAAGYGHHQTMTIDGKEQALADTAARIVGNADGNAPQLFDDITDGKGQKMAGYKIMFMSRTHSLAHKARPPREGQADGQWSDNRYIHRGTKVLVGIPVKNGQMQLGQTVLLDMAVISDAQVPDNFKAEDKIRPRGKQIAGNNAQISKPRLKLERLDLPDMVSGEKSGGGVKLQASIELDGKTVSTDVNSTFTIFETVKPNQLRGFEADARFFK